MYEKNGLENLANMYGSYFDKFEKKYYCKNSQKPARRKLIKYFFKNGSCLNSFIGAVNYNGSDINPKSDLVKKSLDEIANRYCD